MSDQPTFKLTIRAQRPDDWEAIYQIRSEPDVLPNILAVPLDEPERFHVRVAAPNNNGYRLVAEATLPDGTSRVVGSTGLWLHDLVRAHVGDIGMQVATAYQGQGVGSALMAALCDLADNWLNVHRLQLEVYTDNVRGIALYKKFGFEVEATLSQYAFRDGAYVDAHLMGRLNPRHKPDIQNRTEGATL